uniref:WIBG Mago-binding domain-containing protein n=1 Tax=Eutreptiella gymnastica TaxID=73025 RepID=A0A7S1J965_9EUGL|mmetsp:Transcript_77375/g.136470  ORF Transcript_77375/g.136470 Transcript_77375/m.136470 type:complete len:226 (+) Transcript_77375:64-741(+)
MASAFREKRVAGGTLHDGSEYEIIQGSLRPDGTRRPDIKVRKGYVAQDEVRAMETKGSRHRAVQEEVKHWVPGMSNEMHQKQKELAQKVKDEKQAQRSSGRISDQEKAAERERQAKLRAEAEAKKEEKKKAAQEAQQAAQAAKAEKKKAASAGPEALDLEAMGVEELRKTKKNLMKTKNDIAKLEASIEEGKELDEKQASKVARKEQVIQDIAAIESRIAELTVG